MDDGGAQIAIGTLWPTVKLHDLRLAARIAGDITTSRLMCIWQRSAALHVAGSIEGLAAAKGSWKVRNLWRPLCFSTSVG
ncbi:hypothetical protein LNQ03_07815 [Klebsiella pneumoniae subsp. pneumoniae]|nr:hypothetical protein [Klebsiella pneumoniae subsp. pneumoniae]